MGSTTPDNATETDLTEVVTFRLTKGMKRRLEAAARVDERSEASLVRLAVSRELLNRQVEADLKEAA